MDVRESISLQNQVSMNLAKHVITTVSQNSNVIFSPASINVVLSIIAAGSAGATKDQILSFLKFSSTDQLNSFSSEIVSAVLADGSANGGPKLSVANGAWIDKSLSFKPSFKQLLEDSYKAASNQADFQSKAVEVIAEVNSWAEKETNGLITEVLPEGSADSMTKLIFANALYFKGTWNEKFDESLTQEGEFHLLDGAVEKLKSVLMVLGFMSLMLNVTEGEVSKICIPIKYANRMLPCRKTIKSHNDVSEDDDDDDGDNHDNSFFHQCSSKGKTSLISEEGLTQLSYFFFVLACMHILCNLAILLLGMAKMRKWNSWEKETQTVEYLAANDPNRFRITRDTTFARRHLSSWTETSFQLWIKCFFRQFYNSVAKVDYLTLRHGFIFAHVSSNNAFNFQNYIQRSLHEDFKTVVGISPLMWLTVVIFMLLDVSGWRVYFYMSFVPLIIVLVIGTKLEMIVAKMAVTIKENNSVIRGTPLVESNDTHFWFSNPRFLLSILHYTLFLNTFEMAFIVWITWQFGINSCYHDNQGIIITRLVLAVTVQFLSSYITLPLYAIVTQMGSSYKRAILEEQLANVLRHWQGMVRDKKKTIQTPDTDNNSNNNNGDIDSGESPVQTEVASEFRFSGRQSPILQEIQIQEKTER